MQISFKFCASFWGALWALLACFLASACHNEASRSFLSDEWLITGQIGEADFHAKEILALGMDGTRYRTRIQSDYTFALQLPGNSVYAFYVVPDPKKNPLPAAVLTFDDGRNMDQSDTLRLPKPTLKAWLDLGSLDIKHGQAWPTRNPGRELDFDEDGLVDILDPDDQNDGLKDSTQKWEQEKVGICHVDKNVKGHQKFILEPLSRLLSHLQHGDKVGTCKAKRI